MIAPPGAVVLENRHTGEILAMRRLSRNGEEWLELKGTLPPHRQGPPLHVHLAEHEEGRVISGTLSGVVDGQVIRLSAGEAGVFPLGSAHRWWNDGDDILIFEGCVKPVVDLDVYLQAVFDVVNRGPAARPPLFYMAHVAWRHRRTQQIRLAPPWFQALMFATIVVLGRLLGRYRGEAWPGCPTRCAPAPHVRDA